MSRVPVLRTCLPVFGLFAVAAATAALTVACSVASKVDYAECTTSSECREAFGLGWTCGTSGLCEEVTLDARCKSVYPKDLFKAPEKYPDAIVFGSLFDHNTADGDLILVNAANLAIFGANMSGLTGGRLFGMIHCDYQSNVDIDSKTSAEAAVDGAKFLVDQMGVSAIVGPGTSGLAELVFKELQLPTHGPQALLISPSATSPSLTDIDVRDGDKPGLFWRTAPSDSVLSKFLADRMVDDGITNAIVIYASDSYGSGLATALDKNFEPPLELIAFSDADAVLTIVEQVAMKTPGEEVAVVFLASDHNQVIRFLNSASPYAFYEQVSIYLGDAGYNKDVLTQTTGATNLYPRLRGVFPGSPSGSVYEFFLSNYKGLFPSENPADVAYSAYAYDAAWLAIYSAAWAEYQRSGVFTGLDLAFGLQKLSSPKGVALDVSLTTWNTVKSEFKAGHGINIRGASGELDFDPETEETTAPVIFWRINDTNDGFENL